MFLVAIGSTVCDSIDSANKAWLKRFSQKELTDISEECSLINGETIDKICQTIFEQYENTLCEFQDSAIFQEIEGYDSLPEMIQRKSVEDWHKGKVWVCT